MSADKFHDLTADWGPTWTSTALAVLAVGAVLAGILWQIERILIPVITGCFASLSFAGGLWIANIERYKPATATAVSLLVVPISAAVLAAVCGVIFLISRVLFPVSGQAMLSSAILILIGHVGVVIGVSLAIFGTALGLRNVGSEANFRRFVQVGVKTGVVPSICALLFATTTVVLRPSQREQLVSSLNQVIHRAVFAQGVQEAALASFFALVALTGLLIAIAVKSLPFAEFISDTGSGVQYNRYINAIVLLLFLIGSVAATMCILSFAFVATLSLEGVAMRLGPNVYGPLRNVTSSTPLRRALVSVLAVTGTVLITSRLIRRLSQNSLSDGLRRWVPVVTGGLLAAVVISFASPLYEQLIGLVVQVAPESFTPVIQQSAAGLAGRFGTQSIMTAVLAGLVNLTIVLSFVFLFAVRLGYFAEQSSGYALAGTGVFIAVAFAGTIGAPPWLVFAGIVGSLLIIDVGQFGTVLGTEIGRHARTWQTELVHAGGTILVGVVGVGAALAASLIVGRYSLPEPTTTIAALLFIIIGAVSLVIALR